MLYRTRFIGGGLIAFFLFLTFSFSCHIDIKNGRYQVISNEADRHKVLTFFIDGVPPLGGEMVEIEEGSVDPNKSAIHKRPEVVWYIHEPTRSRENCSKCHGSVQQRRFSTEVQMIAQVPDMCYACHESLKPEAMESLVHGPLAIGECLFCHLPHKSQYKFLLKRPIPDLCYGCHEEVDIRLIPDHSKELYSKCNNCHEGHSSSAEHLLKLNWQENLVEIRKKDSKDMTEESEPETKVKEPKADAIKEPESETWP